jgi:hypothetical protein
MAKLRHFGKYTYFLARLIARRRTTSFFDRMMRRVTQRGNKRVWRHVDASGRRYRRRPGVDQLSCERFYSKIESFECTGAQQDEVTRFAEDDIVSSPFAGHVYERRASPSLENRAVRLTKTPLGVPLDAEGFEQLERNPRQFGAGINEHRAQVSLGAGLSGVLDLDVHAKRSHIVRHYCS